MSRQFYTLAEIAAAKAPDLPGSMTSLKRLAEREGWRSREGLCRKVPGQTKPVFEYHVSLLPPVAQARLSLIHSAPANDDADVESDRRKALWERFEGLSRTQKDVCHQRLAAIETAEELERGGMSRTAAAFRACDRHGVRKSAFFDWRKRLAGVDREDWLAALAPGNKGGSEFAECHADAWTALKSDFLRPERPTFSSCYRRVRKAAKTEGWSPIPSERALRRRLDAEVPKSVQVLAREGRDAAKMLYPAQRRVRTHLHAMQAVNMDGHKLDVFVRMADGKIQRVHLVVLQDLHSGKIVAWRLAASENKVAVRLVIGDMVERHGIPDDIVLDNGRAFASKWISGGAPNRYRFKVRDEEPLGLITALGIKLHWTTPYAGQSKPIERAFRDLADEIAKHPFCAGAYTGNKPDAKPENYGSKAVPFDAFKAHVARQIAEHNARPGRTASACVGRSFDDTFAASLAEPSTLVKWPSPAQRALWLLAAEQIRAKKGSGEIHLFGNRYWAQRAQRPRRPAGHRALRSGRPDARSQGLRRRRPSDLRRASHRRHRLLRCRCRARARPQAGRPDEGGQRPEAAPGRAVARRAGRALRRRAARPRRRTGGRRRRRSSVSPPAASRSRHRLRKSHGMNRHRRTSRKGSG